MFRFRSFIFLICLGLVSVGSTFSQRSFHRNKIVQTSDSVIVLDTLPIIPNSVKIVISPTRSYVLDYAKAILRIANETCDTLIISCEYQCFTSKLLVNKPANSFRTYDFKPDLFANEKQNRRVNELNMVENRDSIEKKGHFTRSVVAGNLGGSSVRSDINLQLKSTLKDSVLLNAVLREKNTASAYFSDTYRPEEIDEMYLELESKKVSAKLGDQIVEQKDARWLVYQKKMKGMSVQFTDSNKFGSQDVHFSFSGTRSQFARKEIKPIAGNQGPYSIADNENEAFIQIVEFSEKVFLNGEVLSRGEEADYVFNYASGEIVFSNKLAIDSEMRLFVEYEFVLRNYQRYMSEGNMMVKKGNHQLGISYYRVADNPNIVLNTEYDRSTIAFLQQADSAQNQYLYPSHQEVTGNEIGVFYEQKDSVVNGIVYGDVFIYSVAQASKKYSLIFSYLGENLGNYMLDTIAANGSVYKWIAPVEGIKQGSYEPVQHVYAPVLEQVVDISYQGSLSDNDSLKVEFARSENVLNRFVDQENIHKYAGTFSYQKNWQLTADFKVGLCADYDYADASFFAVGDFADTEMLRKWSVKPEDFYANNSHKIKTGFSVRFREDIIGSADFQQVKIADFGEGQQNNFSLAINKQKFQQEFMMNQSHSGFLNTKNEFTQIKDLFKYKINSRTDFYYDLLYENNAVCTNSQLDSLSFAILEHKVGVHAADSSKTSWNIEWMYRKKDEVNSEHIAPYSVIHQFQSELNTAKTKAFTNKLLLRYRINTLEVPADTAQTGNIIWLDWIAGYFKKQHLLGGSLRASLNSSREPIRQYMYREVLPGQGQFYWNDNNHNNRQEINEFLPAQFVDQANYMRVFLPQNSLQDFKLYRFQANIFGDFRKWKPIEEYFNKKNINLRIDQSFDFLQKNKLSQFQITNSQNELLQNQIQLVSNFMFSIKNWICHYTYTQAQHSTQQFLIQEIYNRKNSLFLLKYHTKKNVQISANFQFEENSQQNSYVNYLKAQFWETKQTIQLSGNWPVLFQYSYRETQANKQSIIKNKFGLGVTKNISSKNNFNALVEFIQLEYSATFDLNTAYLLAEGYTAGKNFSTTLQVNHQLFDRLLVSVDYIFRKSENKATIHQLQLTAKAQF